MASPANAANAAAIPPATATRPAVTNHAALADARRRPMAERLELALSWNAVAAELRTGLRATIRRAEPGR